MQNKLEVIKQKCIEANPSIMELGFGCEIEKDGEIYKLAVETDLSLFSKTTENFWFCVSSKGQAVSLEKNVRTTILGRPIRLADVLLAIREKNKENWLWQKWLDGSHQAKKSIVSLIDYDGWNLLKDNLTDQSQETIDFLSNLLKENKMRNNYPQENHN